MVVTTKRKGTQESISLLGDGFAPIIASVLVALGRGRITLGSRSQGLHGVKRGDFATQWAKWGGNGKFVSSPAAYS